MADHDRAPDRNLCGVLAPVLWAISIAFSASLRPEYSHRTQVISELGERGSSTELVMRYGGFVPTGLMHMAFGAFLYAMFRGNRLAAIGAFLLILNGVGRIGAGMFPCDAGCAGSTAPLIQKLHNWSATLGFVAIIGAAALWSRIFRRDRRLRSLSVYSLASAFVGLVFLVLMVAGRPGASGLYERLSSGVLSLWVLVVATRLWWLGASEREAQTAAKV